MHKQTIPKEYITHSARETQKVATQLAREITTPQKKQSSAVVVALSGDLGAGKTTFAQGFLAACGARGPFTSPTFGIIKEYPIARGSFERVYHIDPYRLCADDVHALGWAEMLADTHAVMLIEWPSIITKILPSEYVSVELSHEDEQVRKIIVG